ncbi:hypothetical protein P7C73_g5967, partial [Tremellales sp. Uapishka_1]
MDDIDSLQNLLGKCSLSEVEKGTLESGQSSHRSAASSREPRSSARDEETTTQGPLKRSHADAFPGDQSKFRGTYIPNQYGLQCSTSNDASRSSTILELEGAPSTATGLHQTAEEVGDLAHTFEGLQLV